MKLLSVDDARARMLAEIRPSAAESVTLAQSIGRVLAEDVAAMRDQPPFTASAMDGWAVRHADTPGSLKIMGESAAGHGFAGALGAGEAVRIFTGAAVPAGADAIVIQENATREGDLVTVPAVPKGEHLRPLGGDFQAGASLLTKGTRMDPWRLCLAASAGRAEVSVHSRPRLASLSTGEEIVEAPGSPGPFQI
jgi:molybdopterin molybdotransferase